MSGSFNTSSTIGAWTIDTQTVVTATPDVPGPTFLPGTVVSGSQGAEWMFVRLAPSQTIVAGDFVYVSSTNTDFLVTSLSNTARLLFGAQVGVAGASATSTATSLVYIWIQRKGIYVNANVVTGALVNALSRTTATGGRLGTTLGAGTTAQILGVTAVTTPASNLANVMLNLPVIQTAD